MSAPATPIAYRPKEAAALLGVSRSTIYEMIAEGKIRAKKIGSATVIGHEELSRIYEVADFSESTKRAQASIK